MTTGMGPNSLKHRDISVLTRIVRKEESTIYRRLFRVRAVRVVSIATVFALVLARGSVFIALGDPAPVNLIRLLEESEFVERRHECAG